MVFLLSTLYALLFTLYSCTPSLPDEAEEAGRMAQTMPDNAGATLPPNIAPLNFEIQEDGDAYVTRFSTKVGEWLVVGGQSVDISLNDWQRLLQSAVGDTLWTDIYVRHDGRWIHFDRMANPVVADSIDPYITYRLIRPGYITYEELTINERCLESFDERIVYENMSLNQGENGQCINCHVPQGQGQNGRSQFHVRQALGGTVFIDGTHITKVNLKTDSTLSAGVYPAWHPTLNLIVYSVNETGQAFHTLDPQKIEVIDYASDLILYDPERNEVLSIGRTATEYESVPCWSPDGKTLYYISAHHDPVGMTLMPTWIRTTRRYIIIFTRATSMLRHAGSGPVGWCSMPSRWARVRARPVCRPTVVGSSARWPTTASSISGTRVLIWQW